MNGIGYRGYEGTSVAIVRSGLNLVQTRMRTGKTSLLHRDRYRYPVFAIIETENHC